MSEKVIDVKGLKVRFETDRGCVYAVNGVDLSLNAGLVGETGAGKTTTALALLRLLEKSTARVESEHMLYCGEEISEMSEEEMRRLRGRDMTMIFQDPMTALNPVLRIVDQVSEIFRAHQNMNRHEAEQAALKTLEMVRIPPERAYEYPHQFSGGMKQRVVIAMALACNPELLIADEPTTALDVTIQAQVLEMMKGLRDKYNTSMLMITHDLGIVAEICDKVSVVYAGRVIEHGTLEDIFENTRHPYTEGLFNSLPNLEARQAQLKPIKGLMPDPSNLPKGCAFCPRCDYAMEICKTEKPKRVYRNETHYVECHLYNKDNIQIDDFRFLVQICYTSEHASTATFRESNES